MATKTSPQRPARKIIGNAATEHLHVQADSPAAPDAIAVLPMSEPDELEDGIYLHLPQPAELPEGYIKRFPNVDCRLSEPAYAEAFQKMFYSLHQSNARLANGKHIDNGADVIRYLLEQYSLATAGS